LELQDRLFWEILDVCRDETVTKDHLPQLAYLNGVFHETLWLHSPAPLIPPRFVHETTKLAGYNIPAGTQVTDHRKDFFVSAGHGFLKELLNYGRSSSTSTDVT
jgi:hypothetical protein